MYDLFKRPATRFTGAMTYPQLAYLNRHFQTQVRDVKKFYYLHPKFVDAKNALGNLLIHIPIRTDLDDQRYSRYVEDMSSGVSRAFGFTSPVYRGKVHESGVVLGPRTNEVVITISTQVDVTNFDREWYKASAVRCLYHTRTDLGLPVLNNTTPGAGWGVTTVDIPMLALQYRYWLKYQVDHMEQKESVYRFIGGFVLPNMIDSYLDIAFLIV